MRYFCLLLILIISLAASNEIKYVSNITFIRNIIINDSELKSVIKLRKPKFFNRSEFSPKKLNKDRISLETFYKSKGFLEVDIISEYSFNSKNNINIKYFINEGDQYKLKELVLSGNKLFTEKEILSKLDHKSIDNNYNPLKIRKSLQLLKRDYLTHGKVDIAVMDEITIKDKDVIARINIYEGNTYFIRNIIINGLDNVKKKYVLRELLFSEGDLYNIDHLDKSKQQIFNSGLFSSVEMHHKKAADDIELIDLEIKVREYSSSSIEANFGFKELEPFQSNISVTGIETHARWIMGNVMNTSSTIEIEASIASEINSDILNEPPLIERDFSLTYRNPWTFYYRIPSRIKYFHEEEIDKSNLVINGITYSILFNKDIDTRYEINSTVEIIESKDSSYSSDLREPTRNINFKYSSNKIEYPLNPKGGEYLSLSFSIYGTILGGKRHFIKIRNEYRKYFKILNNNILATRIVLGFIKNLDVSNNLPAIYQFRLGGQTSLRGWSEPSHPINTDGTLITEMMNIEYRFPIWQKIGGYFFFDSGRLYDNINDFKKIGIIWDYGLGLVYNTNLGPIRLDVGLPYGDVSKGEFHASLLYMF